MEESCEASSAEARQARSRSLEEVSPREAELASQALEWHSWALGAIDPISRQSIDSVLIQFLCLINPLRRAFGLRFA